MLIILTPRLDVMRVRLMLRFFVGKFHGVFNNIANGDEQTSVQLTKSYCLSLLFYCCEIRRVRLCDVRTMNVACNNPLRKIFNDCWRECVKLLQFYCECLPVSYLIRRLLLWRKGNLQCW